MKMHFVILLILGTLIIASNAVDSTKICCVGNSITAGYGLPNATTQGYVALLQGMLGRTYLTSTISPYSATVRNAGVSSRTLLKNGNMPYWKESAFAQIFPYKPGIVTLMLGTNDTKPINWDSHSTEFTSDYTAMLDTFKTITPQPVVIACFPPKIFPNTMTISDSVMVHGIMPKIQSVADKKGIHIVDAYTPFLDKQKMLGDGVHPDTAGNKVLADIFYEGILNYGVSHKPMFRFLWYGSAPMIQGAGTDTLAKPFLTVYPAPDSNTTNCAVVICPGGGYTHLAIDKEGHAIARWFNQNGITAFVLRYRYKPYQYPVPMLDAKRAIRLVRYYASTYNIDTTKIGIMGFSAGGHLASTIGTHFDAGNPNSLDPIERKKSRPDFLELIYPVITLTGSYVHTGSRDALLGTSPAPSQKLLDSLSNEKQVNSQTPQTFLAHGGSDGTVPIQNSQMFADACAKSNVPCKFVTDPGKGHGYGLGGVWPDSCLSWMKARGLLSKAVVGISMRNNFSQKGSYNNFVVTNKLSRTLRISIHALAQYEVSVYSVNGKRLGLYKDIGGVDITWHAPVQGVYVVKAVIDGKSICKRILF